MPVGYDWFWLPVLAWLCTVLPYSLSLKTLRHISAFATNLTINLEPVYGVVLAAFLLREDKELNPGFYAGVVIILVAVFGHPFVKKMVENRQQTAG
jgi:threonine/homoserine efflux transporter RhtA